MTLEYTLASWYDVKNRLELQRNFLHATEQYLFIREIMWMKGSAWRKDHLVNLLNIAYNNGYIIIIIYIITIILSQNLSRKENWLWNSHKV